MGGLFNLAVALVAIWIAWRWNAPLAVHLPYVGRLGAFLLLFLSVAWIGNGIKSLLLPDVNSARPRGATTNGLARRSIGLLWAGFFTLAAFVLTLAAGVLLSSMSRKYIALIGPDTYVWLFCSASMVFFFVLLHARHRAQASLASATHGVRRAHRLAQAGSGGSATFSGQVDEWRQRWRAGDLLLGVSMYDPSLRIGTNDDTHIVSFGTSGAGKGRSVIIPNALTYPHSAIIIDPKGTTAAVTAAARGFGGGRVRRGMGQNVYIVDPFHIVAGRAGCPHAARFNPLSIVDFSKPTVYEDLASIAEALVVPRPAGDPHWDGSARLVTSGTSGMVKEEDPAASLGDVRDALTSAPEELMERLSQCKNHVSRQAAAQLRAAGDRERGSILSTAIQHTDWLASSAMRDALAASDFDLSELKARATTVYLVLPPHYLEIHKRFLRLFVNLTLRAASDGGRSRVPIWMCLDEFYSLGRMDSVLKAVANSRSYNVRLHMILQNLSQLEELYPGNWESLLANAGTIQVFGLNDPRTEGYVAQKLGKATLIGEARDVHGKIVRRPVGTAMLRDPSEVAREVSRDGDRQIIFREGADPLLLRRIKYDKAFRRDQFNPDPDHKGS
ncbi:MAG: type IV secretory system conjugative DNA transfer family protein [Burkholderiales bacterium]|nr:type IV secretory system conjugative DNA transfer family protein [Burkholderiales bacterium]